MDTRIGAPATTEQLRVLTVDEVAETLRVRKQAVYALINRGDLRGIRIGNRFRVPYSALEAFLAGDRTNATEERQRAFEAVAG